MGSSLFPTFFVQCSAEAGLRAPFPCLNLAGSITGYQEFESLLLAAETQRRLRRADSADLSSFRTYRARLSTGYGGLRSGENDSSLGNRRRFGKWSGTEVKIDGEELMIMKESDVMGIVDGGATAAKTS
jgi:hypothetical protein